MNIIIEKVCHMEAVQNEPLIISIEPTWKFFEFFPLFTMYYVTGEIP